MSTAQTAPTKFANVNGVKIAYRRFGKPARFPLVYLAHFRASMDVTDPLLMNIIAEKREVILLDNLGVGHSGGSVPDSIPEMGDVVASLLKAIAISKADILGFSMGGGTAQYLGMKYPDLVNKLVLAGTQSGMGEGVVLPPKEVMDGAGNDAQPTEDEFNFLFFYPSETSLALGRKWFRRIHERQVPGEKRTGFVDGPGIKAMLTAIFKSASDPLFYDGLSGVEAPVLVTNGHTDVMAPTPNSFLLQQKLPNAQLHLYPNSGHGHLFQYPELYGKHLSLFLDDD